MAGRKVSKEVIEIFEKYTTGLARVLSKPAAVDMFKTEFGLTDSEAIQIFEFFDKDYNGKMSIWEFQQFYAAAGNDCQDIVKKFQEIDIDNSGCLDAKEAEEGLKKMQTLTGRNLEMREIDFFIKSSVRDDNTIDLGSFVNLMLKLKLYKPKS